MNKLVKYCVFQGNFDVVLLHTAYISVKCRHLNLIYFSTSREQLNEKNNLFAIVNHGRNKYCKCSGR